MKLFILKPINVQAPAWTPWYDCSFGIVVRAETEDDARKIASDNNGDEGIGVWLAEDQTSCIELVSDGEAGLIIRDFASA